MRVKPGEVTIINLRRSAAALRRLDLALETDSMWCSGLPALVILGLLIPPGNPTAGESRAESPPSHWAFRAPMRSEVPDARSERHWARTPVDAFLWQGMHAAGLEPAAEAGKLTLIRRLRFDLTGLPPSPYEVDAFLADDRPDAYVRLVDRLLASPQYGERWSRMWLDLARYSESDGFKSDKTRPNAWRYRDWVISALNADLPYDKFLSLQLAGDELDPESPDAFIATGFNRHYPFEDNNMIPGLNQQLMLDDVTDTTSSVFLGLTVACARCHDHKYDPISQKDYYALQAVFAAVRPQDDRPISSAFDRAQYRFVTQAHTDRLAAAKQQVEEIERPFAASLLKEKLSELPEEVRKAFETEPAKRSAFQEELLAKHSRQMAVDPKSLKAAMPLPEQKRWEAATTAMQTVTKGAPGSLPVATGMTDTGKEAPPVFLLRKGTFGQPVEPINPGFPAIFHASFEPDKATQGTGRRAALAAWLVDKSNPLTARVMTNRIWQGHFGRGIVATPSDFGTQGAVPTHPELLDWLATEWVNNGGWSLKALHRRIVTSSAYLQSSTPSSRTLAADPDNVEFSRMPRRRLDGEEVRDALLNAAGELNPKMNGPSIYPDLPPGVQTRGGWTRSDAASDRNRRSVYVFARRNLKYPLFDAFDAPDPNTTCPERNVSVNAPQALMLLNSEIVLDAAKALAARVSTELPGISDDQLIGRVYRLTLGREPDAKESARARSFIQDGGSWQELCHAILNLNEFVFVD